MSKDEIVAFSDQERRVIEARAKELGISFEDAVSRLASEGLAKRVKRKTFRGPSSSVRRFHRGGR